MPLARVTARSRTPAPAAARRRRRTAGLDDQAEDEEGFAGEVEEEARVNEHTVFGHERHDEILFRPDRGHLHDRGPPAFGAEHRGSRPPAAGLAAAPCRLRAMRACSCSRTTAARARSAGAAT